MPDDSTTSTSKVRVSASRAASVSRSSWSRQQMQPFERSTMPGSSASSERASSSASTFISPMSLTMTAISRPPGEASNRLSSVVFPAPSGPLTTVTGIGSDAVMFDIIRHTGRRYYTLAASALSRLGSLPLHAAVDRDDLAGHVLGVLAGDEPDDTGDVLDAGEAIKRDALTDLLLHVVRNVVEHVGLDEPRRDAVRGRSRTGEFERDGAREAEQPALGRGVVRLAVVALLGDDARNVDQPPVLGVADVLEEGVRTVEHATQVHVHDALPVLAAHVRERPIDGDAGVVHEHVDRAEQLVDPITESVDFVRFGDVGLERNGGSTLVLDGLCRLVGGGLRRSVVHDDGRAVATELLGDSASDSPRSTRHDARLLRVHCGVASVGGHSPFRPSPHDVTPVPSPSTTTRDRKVTLPDSNGGFIPFGPRYARVRTGCEARGGI